jgi:uncharacterized membrane protein YkvA (DUF1232 family)
MLAAWKARARALRAEVHALSLAMRDPRVPWYAKAVAVCVVAYALSPIDLIPDFIPVLGYLDDVVLVPLGILLARRLVPVSVMDECRARAGAAMADGKPVNRTAAVVIVAIWVALALVAIRCLLRWRRSGLVDAQLFIGTPRMMELLTSLGSEFVVEADERLPRRGRL